MYGSESVCRVKECSRVEDIKCIAVEENFAIDCRVVQEAFGTAGAADLHPTN